MDVGLGPKGGVKLSPSFKNVLILVLVDVGLGRSTPLRQPPVRLRVLSLVLVDVGLGPLLTAEKIAKVEQS